MSRVLLRASGLRRRYGARRALDGVDLEIRAGEVLALFGPNGAGKTTLLKVLASLLRPSSGAVEIGEGERSGAGTRRGIGFVSHETYLYPQLTGEENLRFHARLFAVRDREARMREVLSSVGLVGRESDRAGSYSRGMAQRLTLARALLHDPALLLFDEPWTGLDPEASTMLSDLLRREAAGGRGIVVTSHDFAQGLHVATRVAILHRGRIAFEGASAELDPEALDRLYRTAAGGRASA